MSGEYEVMLGKRVVSTRTAPNARKAAIDYVRSLGFPSNELTYLAGDAVAWRGAIYRAEPAVTPPRLYPEPPVTDAA